MKNLIPFAIKISRCVGTGILPPSHFSPWWHQVCGVGCSGSNANKRGCREQHLLCQRCFLSGRVLGPFTSAGEQPSQGFAKHRGAEETCRVASFVWGHEGPSGIPGSDPARVQGS